MNERIKLLEQAHDAIFNTTEELSAIADANSEEKVEALAELVNQAEDLQGAIEDFLTQYRRYF